MLEKETKTTITIEGSDKPQIVIILVLLGVDAVLLLLLHLFTR